MRGGGEVFIGSLGDVEFAPGTGGELDEVDGEGVEEFVGDDDGGCGEIAGDFAGDGGCGDNFGGFLAGGVRLFDEDRAGCCGALGVD